MDRKQFIRLGTVRGRASRLASTRECALLVVVVVVVVVIVIVIVVPVPERHATLM
jgi:hypothetical protein